MKILILGAGQVGGTLAENLAKESIDITLVDNNIDVLEELQTKLDIKTVDRIDDTAMMAISRARRTRLRWDIVGHPSGARGRARGVPWG